MHSLFVLLLLLLYFVYAKSRRLGGPLTWKKYGEINGKIKEVGKKQKKNNYNGGAMLQEKEREREKMHYKKSKRK